MVGTRSTRAASRCSSRRRRARHPTLIPAHKPERIAIDGVLGGRLVRATPPPPAGAPFGWSGRLGALLLPSWWLGASRALARSRSAGRRLAADARRGLA